jgi:hypothetical protein
VLLAVIQFVVYLKTKISKHAKLSFTYLGDDVSSHASTEDVLHEGVEIILAQKESDQTGNNNIIS